MRKLFAALIACAFATVAFAQGTTTDNKKVNAEKPYGNAPAPAAPAKDAAPMKKDATATTAPAAKGTTAPAAKSNKDMTAEEKKAAKAQKKKVNTEKQAEEIKADTKKP